MEYYLSHSHPVTFLSLPSDKMPPEKHLCDIQLWKYLHKNLTTVFIAKVQNFWLCKCLLHVPSLGLSHCVPRVAPPCAFKTAQHLWGGLWYGVIHGVFMDYQLQRPILHDAGLKLLQWSWNQTVSSWQDQHDH